MADKEKFGVWVEAAFEADFRFLSEDETADLIKNVKFHRTHDRLGLPPPTDEIPADLKNIKELEEIPSHFLRMWISIDRKLDTLLRIASGNAHKLEGASEGIVARICQGGLELKSDSDLKTSDRCIVRLSPPTFPGFTIDVVGKVLSVDKAGGKKLKTLEFEAIHEDDRELLIGYIFKRQREVLRSRMEGEFTDTHEADADKA